MNIEHKVSKFSRRRLLQGGACAVVLSTIFSPVAALAKTYMDAGQAQKLIWGDKAFTPRPITLTKEQRKSIKKASKVRVRNAKINAFVSATGEWFIVDQIIGKHENIDVAFGIDNTGKIKGVEVLVYRESYGHEIINPKWMAQFHGRDNSKRLKLDRDIKNISGATLSCRHITDGVNRLTHTWDQVLRHQA